MEMYDDLPRICPSCSYEDDDPYTSLEANCPMCNINFDEAVAEAARKKEEEQLRQQQEEERLKKLKEDEAEWRQRRSETESENAKNFDPSFIAQARRRSLAAQTEAQARELEILQQAQHNRDREDARVRALRLQEELTEARRVKDDDEARSSRMKAEEEGARVRRARAVEEARALRIEAERRVQAVREEEARRLSITQRIPAVSTVSSIGVRDSVSSITNQVSNPNVSSVSASASQSLSSSAPAALLHMLSTLPRSPLTVYITGMPETPVGKTSIKRVLQEGLEYMELNAHVTLQDDCLPPSGSSSSEGHVLVLSVYDICNEKSFDFSVNDQCKKFASEFQTVLVGNKVDLEYWRQVKVEKAVEAIKTVGASTVRSAKASGQEVGSLDYLEVSAHTGLHVGFLMDMVLKNLFAPHFNRELVNQLMTESIQEEVGSDPELMPYFRMLSVGVAAEAVALRMTADGVRRRVLLSRFPRVEYIPTLELDISSGSEISSSDVSYDDSSSDSSNESRGSIEENLIFEERDARVRGRKKAGKELSRDIREVEKKLKIFEDNFDRKSPFDLDLWNTYGSRKKEESTWQGRKSRRNDLSDVGGGDGAEGGGAPRGGKKARKMSNEKEKMKPVPRRSRSLERDMAKPLPRPSGGLPPSSSSSSSAAPLAPPPPPPVTGHVSVTTRLERQLEEERELSELIEKVQDLNNMSASISAELQEQNQLLVNIEESVDVSKDNLQMNNLRQAVCDYGEDDDDDYDDDENMWENEVLDEEPEEEEMEEWAQKEDICMDYLPDDDEIGVDKGDIDLASAEKRIDSVKNIMHMNIDQVIERGESLDYLVQSSDDLQHHAQFFKKESKRLKRSMALQNCLCCCCIICVKSADMCANAWRACIRNSVASASKCSSSLMGVLRSLLPKKSLMDNVLADTENAFQTLAKSLNYLIGSNDKFNCLGAAYFYMFGVWHKILAWVVSCALILSSTVIMILPSFFTLLIVRTSTIEKESKSFGIRQETIRYEKKEQSALRWVRIILRSLPMTAYLVFLPYFLVYRVFPSVTNDQITLLLVGYLAGIIVLQVLGSVRVFHSWKTRDTTVPKAPDMYYMETIEEKKGTMSCLTKCCQSSTGQSFDALDNDDCTDEKSTKVRQLKKKTPVPVPPNTFTKSAANIIVLFSLSLEYFQMASFSLQSNPLDGDSALESGGGVLLAPTAAPTVEPDDDFWGTTMFDSVYIKVAMDSDLTITFMWAAVGAVALLVVVFATQFLFELKLYGRLLQRVEDKDEAKDSFFFSFTGAIVYGHGKPNNISKRVRLVVSVLSDALFLVISMQLLAVLACDFDDADSEPTLRAKESVVCWVGEHALLATLSLIAYAFYVPLSIMITPMLMEVPSPEGKDKPKDEGVAFLKLYLMTINVVKSVMLVVAVLGPQSVSALVIATILSSLLLGCITVAWYSRQDISSLPYFSAVHPCNMAFINYWKAASYTTSVVSAVIVVIFHSLENSSSEFVSQRSLTDTLITSWVCIIIIYLVMYRQHYNNVKPRRQLVADLISYPFQWRDLRETTEESNELLWWNDGENTERLRRIPGFFVSPWQDYCLGNLSPTGASPVAPAQSHVEDVRGQALSYRLMQHYSPAN